MLRDWNTNFSGRQFSLCFKSAASLFAISLPKFNPPERPVWRLCHVARKGQKRVGSYGKYSVEINCGKVPGGGCFVKIQFSIIGLCLKLTYTRCSRTTTTAQSQSSKAIDIGNLRCVRVVNICLDRIMCTYLKCLKCGTIPTQVFILNKRVKQNFTLVVHTVD